MILSLIVPEPFSLKDGDKGEDSVKLSLALKTARRDLTKAQVELNTMRANYGDVVPRRDFESQEEKYNELFEKVSESWAFLILSRMLRA